MSLCHPTDLLLTRFIHGLFGCAPSTGPPRGAQARTPEGRGCAPPQQVGARREVTEGRPQGLGSFWTHLTGSLLKAGGAMGFVWGGGWGGAYPTRGGAGVPLRLGEAGPTGPHQRSGGEG